MKLFVLGGSKHKGEYEGIKYDYSKIYVPAPMEQSEIKKGQAGVDMRAVPEVFEQIEKMNFAQPVFCEVDTELRALGGGNARETVVSIKQVTPKS